MDVLLDTHIALWAVLDDSRLSKPARKAILDADRVVVSAASVWELAIKAALPRSNLELTATQALVAFIEASYEIMPIEARHVLVLESLEAHHRDPFDRLLVAQARSETLMLLTADPTVALYDAPLMFVG